MRQRIGWRVGIGAAIALPGVARAQAPAAAAPTWFALLPDVLCGLVALALVAFGLWLLYLAVVRLDGGEFSFRRHAGGFGGSSTGWQVSQSMARLVAGLTLILLALALAMARLPVKEDAKPEAPADAKAGAAPEAKASPASAPASAK